MGVLRTERCAAGRLSASNTSTAGISVAARGADSRDHRRRGSVGILRARTRLRRGCRVCGRRLREQRLGRLAQVSAEPTKERARGSSISASAPTFAAAPRRGGTGVGTSPSTPSASTCAAAPMTFRARRRRRTATATRISSAASGRSSKAATTATASPTATGRPAPARRSAGRPVASVGNSAIGANATAAGRRPNRADRATARRRGVARTAHVAASTRGAQPAAVPTRCARPRERSRRCASASRARVGRAARTVAPTTSTASRRSSRTFPRPSTGRPATNDVGSGAPPRVERRTAAALATSARGGNASSTGDPQGDPPRPSRRR